MTKVMVEVEEGTWTWACAMAAQGKMVECERYARPDPACSMMIWSGPVDPFKYRSSILRWRLHVEPPEPITVQPGTFAWAVAHLVAGRTIASKTAACRLWRMYDDSDCFTFTSTFYNAPDWEVVK